MINLAQGYFRKTVFKTYRWFKHPRKLKKSPVMRWFATHFLSKQVWKPTQHTMAGGMAIGMCIMIQLLPGQMFVAAVIAAVQARGFSPADDNEADAIAILLWAIETGGGVR